ncbi:MAG: hypothetical protein V7L11_24870 [Nostoc sp.]
MNNWCQLNVKASLELAFSEIQTAVAKHPKTSGQALLKLYLNHGYTFS